MKSRQERIRSQFQVESLEGRVVLSSRNKGSMIASHHAAEVDKHGQGQDDPAGHDANDDHGGMVQVRGKGRGGADDLAGHDANDHRGVKGGHR